MHERVSTETRLDQAAAILVMLRWTALYFAWIGAVADFWWATYGTFDDVTLTPLVWWSTHTFVRVTGTGAVDARSNALPHDVARPVATFKTRHGPILVQPSVITGAVLAATM